MSNQSMYSSQTLRLRLEPSVSRQKAAQMMVSTAALAASITKAASKQTYYTIRLLVDRDQVDNAYRAYAYFRWLDDQLDGESLEKSERIALLERQSALIDSCYRGKCQPELSLEERIIVDLIRSDQKHHSGLRSYIQNMMAVMEFDATRRDTLTSEQDLTEYSRHLATAVTEALHYFIGHDCFAPHDETRYLAVTASHITHMLRDMLDDINAGYYNIPRDYLEAHDIAASDVNSAPYRAWVRERVERARDYFQAGREYLARVESMRCRIAGYAYIARFEGVLDAIEKDGYKLRIAYRDRKRPGVMLKMLLAVIKQTVVFRSNRVTTPVLPSV